MSDVAWVFNTDSSSAVRYTQFPFNSLVSRAGQVFGVAADGIYLLSGDTDDGTPIEASIETGDISFDSDKDKNVQYAYVQGVQDGDLTISTVVSRGGVRALYWYDVLGRDDTSDDSLRRIRLGRGVRGTQWQFRIGNVDGCAFSVSSLSVLVDAIARRG